MVQSQYVQDFDQICHHTRFYRLNSNHVSSFSAVCSSLFVVFLLLFSLFPLLASVVCCRLLSALALCVMLVVRFRVVVCRLVTLLSSRKARKPSCACDASLRARERIQARYWSVDCCSPVHTCTEQYSQLMSILRNSCWLYLLLGETLLTRPAASHSLHRSTSSLTTTTITLASPKTVYQCATL